MRNNLNKLAGDNFSAILSETARLFEGKGLLTDIILASGADASKVILYDSINTASDKIISVASIANDSKAVSLKSPIAFDIGLYAVISGTTPDVTFCWQTDD